MFKKFVFVAVAMLMAANSAMANDDIASMLANLDGAKDQSAQVENADLLGQKDVDALLGDDKNDGEEAVAACFRNFGHGHSHSHGSYNNCHSNWYGNHNCYNNYSSYNNYSYCSQNTYNYCAPSYCYTPTTYTCYTPVTYTCYTPCYTSYWGCW